MSETMLDGARTLDIERPESRGHTTPDTGSRKIKSKKRFSKVVKSGFTLDKNNSHSHKWKSFLPFNEFNFLGVRC